ncbi:unnamed protein product [Mytilus edulis]|uniref:Uncharacterized protein n=1 Tax=Mytilus edulis TaxID=6550 RepID=A0A8S3Q7I3_MYTED|nr:unnamed protein product [Mytilus edulis]
MVDKNKVIPCATERSLIDRLTPYCSLNNKLCMFVPHVDSAIRIPHQRTTKETVTNVSVSASVKNIEKQISPLHHITTGPMDKQAGYQGIVGGNNPSNEAEDILNSWYRSLESKKKIMIEEFSTSLSIKDVNSNIPSSIDTKTDIKDMKYTPTLYSKLQGSRGKKPIELTELTNIHIPFMSSLEYITGNSCTERGRTANYNRLHDFKSISPDKIEKKCVELIGSMLYQVHKIRSTGDVFDLGAANDIIRQFYQFVLQGLRHPKEDAQRVFAEHVESFRSK